VESYQAGEDHQAAESSDSQVAPICFSWSRMHMIAPHGTQSQAWTQGAIFDNEDRPSSSPPPRKQELF
jgi:hypothetical protein